MRSFRFKDVKRARKRRDNIDQLKGLTCETGVAKTTLSRRKGAPYADFGLSQAHAQRARLSRATMFSHGECLKDAQTPSHRFVLFK
jgi:hypothetical protein